MADVQIAVIDPEDTQLALAAPAEAVVNVAVPGVQGPIGLTGSVTIAQAGTAATPGIRFESDTNTGIYSPGADQLAVSTGATERLRITSAGNVGIGTASPGAKLQISDSFVSAGTSNYLRLQSESAVDSTVMRIGGFAYAGNARSAIDFVQNGGTGFQSQLVFSTSAGADATERARIDSSGRLLVGTSSTVTNGQGNASLQLTTNSSNYYSADFGHFSNDAFTGAVYFKKSRSTTAGGFASVVNGDLLGDIRFAGADGTTYIRAASIECRVDGTPGTNDMPGRLVFSTTADGAANPTERMRINNTGFTNIYGNGTVVAVRSGAAAGTSESLYGGYHSATSTSNGTASYAVWTNGNVVNTNNSYGAISDIKLKENIVDANSQWADLKALQVRKYNFKEGQTHTQIGLVAQEVELVSPGLVSESTDRDESGNDLGTVTKSVNYSVLYMKAVKALQEAMERIEALEARLTAAGI